MLAAHTNSVVVASSALVMQASDLTVLAVPDDRIEIVAAGLGIKSLEGKAVVHTSGVQDVSVRNAVR
jgi:hypothetical protein